MLENLIARADLAIELTFYIESSWIIYSIIEERLLSLTKNKLNLDPIRDNYHGCVQILLDSINQSDFLKQLVGYDLLQDLDKWRLKRNDVMHELAKEDIDDDRIKHLAIEGRLLLAKIAVVNIKAKKKVSNVKINN